MTQYYWLGKRESINGSGELKSDFFEEAVDGDLWPVIASKNDKFHPGFLFPRKNVLMRSFFQLLGFEIDAPTGADWFAAIFSTFTLSQFPPSPDSNSHTFLAPDENITLTSENGPNKINYFKGESKFQINDNSGQPNAQLDLTLGPELFYETDAFTNVKTATAIRLRFKWIVSKTRILLVETFPSDNTEHESVIGIFSQGGVVSGSLNFDLGFTQQNAIYFETACKMGETFTIDLIPDLSVKANFTLNALKLRFKTDGMGLVLGPPLSREIFSVNIALPLVESSEQSSKGLARLLSPYNKGGDDYLALNLEVSFGHPFAMRPGEPVDPRHAKLREPLLALEAKDGELKFTPGGLNTESLGLLAARVSDWSVLSAVGIKLPLLASPLGSLGNSNDPADALLKTLEDSDSGVKDKFRKIWHPSGRIPLPFSLVLNMGGSTGTLTFLITLYIDLWAGRLAEDRAYLYCVPSESTTPSLAPEEIGRQWVDLDAFAFSLPEHPPPTKDEDQIPYPTEHDHDCILDFGSCELVVDFRRTDPSMRIAASEIVIPGKLNLPNPDNLKKELESRFKLEMEAFDPEDWSAENPDPSRTVHLRIGPKGLSLAGRAIPGSSKTKIPILTAGEESTDNITIDLVDRGEGAGRFVVVNNVIPYGELSGSMQVPGFKNYTANVSVAVRQDDEKKPPRIETSIELANPEGIADLKLDVLQAKIHELRADLTWVSNKWDIKIFASFTAWLAKSAAAPGGLDSLKKKDALRADDVNLLELNVPEKGNIKFRPKEDKDSPERTKRNAIDFEILEGQFAVRAKELEIHWVIDGTRKLIELTMTEAVFEYRNPGTLDVAIESGALAVDIVKEGPDINVDLRIPARLGIDITIGDAIHCAGIIGWFKDDVERFIGVKAAVKVPSFPEVTAAIKFGVGVKSDGSIAPNVMLFAEYDIEAELFPSVIVKSAGAGIAVNNRPKGFSADPDPDEILKELPTLNVADPFAWRFVREPGTQAMVLMRAMLGSQRGEDTQLFLLETLLTFDSSLAITAAGKLWLFSKQSFVNSPANKNRPLAVSAAVLNLRRQTFALTAESRPNPAMEKGGQFSKLFDRGRVRMSVYLSDSLADFYLEEVSYRDNLLGVNVSVEGQYRLAAGRFGILNRCSLSFRGDFKKNFDLVASGFQVRGLLILAGEFAGLVSARGVASYALIVSELDLRVKGYLVLPGVTFVSKTIRVVIPPIIITIRVLKRKGWRLRWRKKRITLSERKVLERTIQIPKPVMERKYAPEQCLNVSIRGNVGFDESGAIGFSGSISVVVNVCGFHRRLSAEMEYQPHVVNRVRKRTAGIEQRINQLRGIAARPRIDIPFAAPAVGSLSDSPLSDDSMLLSSPEAAPEDWIYIRRERGNRTVHLLIPAPGSRWLAPKHGNLDHYVNLPRSWPVINENNEDSDEIIQKGDEEFKDASILRGAVTRMMVHLRDIEKPCHSPEHEPCPTLRRIELMMPWDRYNLDALSPDASTDDLTEAARRLSRIETLMLEGAAASDADDHNTLRRAAPAELVSDPRWESDNPILLRPQARNLPVKSADWRPPEEILRDTAGADPELNERLRAFDRLRRIALRQQRKLAVNPEQTERLADARADIVAMMMQDLEAVGETPLFGENPGITLSGELEGTNIISLPRRRRMPVVVNAKEGGENTKLFQLHVLVLQNCTDLDELLGAAVKDDQVELELKAVLKRKENGKDMEFNFEPEDLAPINLPSDEKTLAEANPGWNHELKASDFRDNQNTPGEFKHDDQIEISLKIKITGADTDTPLSQEYQDLNDFRIFVRFEDKNAETDRRLGLFFETEGTNWRLDFEKPNPLQVFRRSIKTADGVEQAQSLVRVREFKPFQLRNVMFDLDPRQHLIPLETKGAPEDAPASQVLRIHLPVRLTQGFVTEHLPGISHFRVYRAVVTAGEAPNATDKMGGAAESQLAADNVQLCFDHAENNGRNYLMFNGLMMTDQLIVQHQPEGPPLLCVAEAAPGGAGGLIPGRQIPFDVARSRLRYWVAAVRYDDKEGFGDIRGAMYWKTPIKLHIPPPSLPLPDMALVVQADGLLLKKDNNPPLRVQPLPMALDEENPGQSAPRTDPAFMSDLELEIYAEREPVTASGYYGMESENGDPSEDNVQRAEDVLHMEFPVAPTTRYKTLIGRIALNSSSKLGSDKDGLFEAGWRNRLYARLVRRRDPKDQNEDAALAPLPVHLVRKALPDPGTRLPPGRTLPALERIPVDDWNRTLREGDKTDPTDWLQKTDFGARKSSVGKKRGIAFEWHEGGPTDGIDGGFELVVQDADEHRAIYRTTSELLPEEEYRGLVRDLYNNELWVIPPRKELSEIPWKDTPINLDKKAILPYYVYAADQNPVAADFVFSRKTVQDTLGLFVGSSDAQASAGPMPPEVDVLDDRLDDLMDLIRRIRALDVRTAEVRDDPDEYKQMQANIRTQEALRSVSGALLHRFDLANELFISNQDGETPTADLVSAMQSWFDAVERHYRSPISRRLTKNAEDALKQIRQMRLLATYILLGAELPQKIDSSELSGLISNDGIMKSYKELIDFDDFKKAVGKFWPEDEEKTPSSELTDLVKELSGYLHTKPEDNAHQLDTIFINNARLAARRLSVLIEDYSKKEGLNEEVEGLLTEETEIISERIARSVPQSAGLTRVVNALKQDLEARGLRLIRRGRSQLNPEDKDKNLVELLPDGIFSDGQPTLSRLNGELVTPPRSDSLVNADSDKSVFARSYAVGLFNLLEYMGFALDIAASDELGRLAAQEQLAELVLAQPWPALLTAGNKTDHRVLLVRIREPDGDLSPATSIGPSFLKLLVLPGPLIPLLATKPDKDDIGTDDIGNSLKRSELLKIWLEVRGIKVDDTELEKQGKVLANFMRTALRASEKAKKDQIPLQLFLEERNGLFKKRPIRNDTAYGFWPLAHEAGQEFVVGARRISRYEPLVRWIMGREPHRNRTPMPDFIRNLENDKGKQCRHHIVFNPLSSASDARQPVKCIPAPHPLHPGFLMRLPRSGQRSALSALSRRRTGFAGTDLAFYHKFVAQDKFTAENGNGLTSYWIAGINPPEDIPTNGAVEINVEKSKWDDLNKKDDILAVVACEDENSMKHFLAGKPIEVSNPAPEDLSKVTLKISISDEEAQNGWKANELWFLPDSKHDFFPVLHAVIQPHWLDDKKQFRVKRSSQPISMEDHSLLGRLVLLIKGNEQWVRFIQSATASEQSIVLDQAAPEDWDKNDEVFIFLGEPALRVKPLVPEPLNRPTLLRFEEAVIADNLPYHHKYAAQLAHRYLTDDVEKEQTSTVFNSKDWPFISRRPSRLGYRPHLVQKVNIAGKVKYQVTLHVCCYGDHLTALERRSMNAQVDFWYKANNGPFKDIEDTYLPDLDVRYNLYWAIGDDNLGESLVKVTFDPLNPLKLKQKWMGRFANNPDSEVDLEIWRPPGSLSPIYSARLDSEHPFEKLPGKDDPKRLVLQISRNGEDSPIIRPEVTQ